MPFRLFAAAAMAALAATLGMMVVHAVITPLNQTSVPENDFLLLHHLALGLAGGLLVLPLLLNLGGGYRTGFLLGAGIFAVFCLFPWLAQPESRPGRVPGDLALWLFSVTTGLAALWLLWRRDWRRRLAGLLLLALPLLLGFALAVRPDALTTPGFGEAGDPDIAVWRDLGLNLLFWLLLGGGSALAAARVLTKNKAAPEAGTGP